MLVPMPISSHQEQLRPLATSRVRRVSLVRTLSLRSLVTSSQSSVLVRIISKISTCDSRSDVSRSSRESRDRGNPLSSSISSRVLSRITSISRTSPSGSIPASKDSIMSTRRSSSISHRSERLPTRISRPIQVFLPLSVKCSPLLSMLRSVDMAREDSPSTRRGGGVRCVRGVG